MTVKDTRLNKPQSVRRMVNQLINDLRKDTNISKVEKAKTIGYLSNIILKSIEMSEITERLESIEKQIKGER